jgi:hypothetical protein
VAPASRGAILALLTVLLAGCPSGTFAGGVFRNARTAYRLGPLPGQWHRINLPGGNVAFRHESGGSILANSLCRKSRDVSLDVLTNQTLFGFEERRERSRAHVTLDGRAALRTRVSGTLDGVPVELELLVLRKDGCIYDLQLVAAPASFDARIADFDAMVAAFQVLPGSAE